MRFFALMRDCAREHASFWLKKHAHTVSSSRRQAAGRVWESSQVTGLPNNARFRCRRGRLFFSSFLFFCKPRSIVQLPPRSYAHASRVPRHRNFIATLSSLSSSPSSSSCHHRRRRRPRRYLFSFFLRTSFSINSPSIVRTILFSMHLLE